MNCPKCGKELPDEWKSCPYCGTVLGQSVCPKCGKAVERDWVSCPFCVTPLVKTSAFDLADDVFAAEREELEAQFKYCKSCGAQVGKGAKFCTVCKCEYFYDTKAEAAKSATRKYCAACGAENPAEGKFCFQCGGEKFVKFKEEYEKAVREEAERKKREAERKKAEEAERKRREEEERKRQEEEAKRVVLFGRYPKFSENVSEPIEWRILKRHGGNALLITKDIVDTHRFDERSNNYGASELRRWLNSDFYNKAFNEEEKRKIQVICVDNSLASTEDSYNSYTCANTYDMVFMLSKKEVNELLPKKEDRKKKPTEYAKSRSAYTDKTYGSDYGYGIWWLRSPSKLSSNVKYVLSNGHIYDESDVNTRITGIVPAIWVKMD